MRWLERSTRVLVILAFGMIASHLALKHGTGILWKGLAAAHAVTGKSEADAPYDLTELRAVNETLKKIRTKYVDPDRVKPRRMFLNALNQIQRRVAPVIVLHDEGSKNVRVRVDTEEKEFRVDTVQGPWDLSARLREVFVFLQEHLKGTEVKLDEVEYAACNGMLETLDPHSVFLSPEAYADMNLSTTGHFGGLGIVISIRDQMLTVMKPMPGTPAGRAGLRRMDRITKIDNESTMNMPLDDAVKRLRGEPGAKVRVHVHREGKGGWKGSRPFTLTREIIRIKSVEHHDLDNGIGYVRLKQFQATSAKELAAALEELAKKGPLKGLVLDLRGNPGGLLDQAARIADKFLGRGVIVSTVGNGEERDEKRARRPGTEPEYPMVVLTSGSSASASEIVAGALKNHDRAVVMGQTTFGKGSVQLVYSRLAGEAALKLTIAQYLTPGDISIQGVGVTPDVELDPMTADALEMDLFMSQRRMRERDLDKSLTHHSARSTQRPWTVVRYNLPESERKEWRQRGGQVADKFLLDFPIRFARDLVARLPAGKPRLQQLEKVEGYIDQEQASQIEAAAADLKALGVDWSRAPEEAPTLQASDFQVSVRTDRPGNAVTAGEAMELTVEVTNKGSHPVYQLRAITKSDSAYYDEKELVFGKIEPGATATARAPLGFCRTEGKKPGSSKPVPLDAPRVCFIPKDGVTRQDVLKVRFSAEGSTPPPDAEVRLSLKSLPQPNFAYTFQVVDNRKGNGDGQLSKGENATLYLNVKNVGNGPSHETQALLQNLTGDGLLLRAGRFDISNMAPGDTRRVAFTFDVLESLKENLVKVEVSVVDRDLRVSASEKLTIPVNPGGFFVKPERGTVTLKVRAQVRAQPLANAQVVGALPQGSTTRVSGSFGEYVKVLLGGNRFGFIEASTVEPGSRVNVQFEPLMTHSPPTLDVKQPVLATRESFVKISGTAHDGDQVLDTYIFVGAQKVFYQSNRNGSEPKSMSFEHVVPLNPGINVINVVSRENEDVATGHTVVVRRDGPNGESLATPKRQTFAEDWEFTQ